MPRDAATDEVAAGLRAWARGSYPMEAAAELLVRACSGRLLEGPWVAPVERLPDDHDQWYWLDVDQPAEAGVLSGGEKRVLDLAVSLAYAECPVSLNEVLSGLDRASLELVLAAVAHAAGSHQQSRMVNEPSEAGVPRRVGFEELPSAYPWPTDRRTDGPTDGRTDGPTDGRTDGPTDGRTDS